MRSVHSPLDIARLGGLPKSAERSTSQSRDETKVPSGIKVSAHRFKGLSHADLS